MPPRPKNTRQEIVDAAVSIIRENGPKALTARSLGSVLHASPSSVFTHFSGMEEILSAAEDKARAIYDEYVQRGLRCVPPFKGMAMEMIHFAAREPQLYAMLFMTRSEQPDLQSFLDAEGHLPAILDAVRATFGIDGDTAYTLYANLRLYAHGIAVLSASGACTFTDEELSTMLGNACRGLLMAILAEKNDGSKEDSK